jgi:large subunit ribosomal protein L10
MEMADLSKIVEDLSSLTVLEAAELSKLLEEKWGVSAAAPVAAPKVATDFAKTNDKLVILGGSLGRTSLNPEGIKALASLPSLDELRGKLVGLIASPATRVAQVLAAPAAQVARVVGAYANKSEAA